MPMNGLREPVGARRLVLGCQDACGYLLSALSELIGCPCKSEAGIGRMDTEACPKNAILSVNY